MPFVIAGIALLIAVAIIFTQAVPRSTPSDENLAGQGTYSGPNWCFLEASQAQSGQPAILRWQVPVSPQQKPTSGFMNPPLSGAVDYTRDGSGNSMPLTQDTTFTLTISNGEGSYSCSATATVIGTSQYDPTAKSAGLNPLSCASCTADQACINGACVALPTCNSIPGQFCVSDDDGTPGVSDRTMPGMGTCGAGQYCMRCRGRNVPSGNSCVPGPTCTPCTTKVVGAPHEPGVVTGIPNSCGSDGNVALCQPDNCIEIIICQNGCQTFSDGGSACR